MIRFAVSEDIPEILEIYRPYVEGTTVSFEWTVPSLEEFMERFQGISSEFPWLVWETDGRIAGYAYAERAFERQAYQWSVDIAVYIDSKYHHMGIGRRLYQALEEILSQQGYVNVYALVTQYNQSSIDFHKAIGYTEVARFPNIGYKSGLWLSVIWLEKQLSSYDAHPGMPGGIKELDESVSTEILKKCGAR